ncbi:unnamed protein product [Nesidiocoris tenuis]|uniref:Uncharacterized protein n=1 Tax=Nesidiocoris tenuis TaxID=355587 RepID=A0A6H5HDN6_9HEMI|nr:unnamed protein product [Nesidiocoris tenuis]
MDHYWRWLFARYPKLSRACPSALKERVGTFAVTYFGYNGFRVRWKSSSGAHDEDVLEQFFLDYKPNIFLE